MKRTADFYVVLEPRGSTRAACVFARMNRPATDSDQIAVRVRLTLPDNAFAIWTPLVEAEVEPGAFVPPTAEVVAPEDVSPLGHGTPVPEEATLPSGDARVAAL